MQKQASKSLKSEDQSNADENCLRIYLKEIGKVPLLTKEEETKIAKEAKEGNIAARNKLIQSNLRFVVTIAKKYQNKGLPLSDLISEGNIGLINSLEKFDPDKGYHFISYAVWWIRQAIQKALSEKSRMIRLPTNQTDKIRNFEKARDNFGDVSQIAELMDADSEYMRELVNISKEMLSLENTIGGDSDLTLGERIEDDKYQTPEEYAIQSVLNDNINLVLDTLPENEAKVISYRYGLGGNFVMSLEEVGKHLSLTRERIRQIEKKALKRLQAPSRKRFLGNYVA
ncbi:MAG: RNA polymerase sigma factor RpoD/SigA [Treponema sp.]|jgi:RNA polymerase primary sigma factor|nr:RNA polymerase sigma factor RpoD/SigA [Treponema sp.]